MFTKANAAKFFCENCGSEVPENAKLCKKCGKFFISVRCPNCGKSGTSKEFKNGCPECGYAVGKNNGSKKKTYNNAVALNQIFASAGRTGRVYEKNRHDSSLPLWIYLVTGVMLVAVMIAVYSCIKNPVY